MGFGADPFFYQQCTQTPARVALEAADYAEGIRKQTPVELHGYWQTQRWGLPYDGGWMDQPAGLLDRYTDAYWYFSAWQAWLKLEAGELSAWKQAHPDLNRAVNVIRRLRKNAK